MFWNNLWVPILYSTLSLFENNCSSLDGWKLIWKIDKKINFCWINNFLRESFFSTSSLVDWTHETDFFSFCYSVSRRENVLCVTVVELSIPIRGVNCMQVYEQKRKEWGSRSFIQKQPNESVRIFFFYFYLFVSINRKNDWILIPQMLNSYSFIPTFMLIWKLLFFGVGWMFIFII